MRGYELTLVPPSSSLLVSLGEIADRPIGGQSELFFWNCLIISTDNNTVSPGNLSLLASKESSLVGDDSPCTPRPSPLLRTRPFSLSPLNPLLRCHA